VTSFFGFALAFGLSEFIGLRRFVPVLHDERNSAIGGIEGILFFAPDCRWSSGSGGFPERRGCVLGTIEYLKDRDKLGHLQHLLRVTTQASQLDGSAGLFGRCEESYQGAQSTAVNVRDARQIQNDFAAALQEASDALAERRGLLAKVNNTAKTENDDVVDFAGDNIESHDIPSPQPRARTGCWSQRIPSRGSWQARNLWHRVLVTPFEKWRKKLSILFKSNRHARL
jgi:hypothetical protein